MRGITNQAVRSALRTELGNFQVHHPDYPADRDLRYALTDVDALLDETVWGWNAGTEKLMV